MLDSYQNPPTSTARPAAIYKQHAPLVNASRKPGEWQVYDIVFHAPKFDADGKMIQRGDLHRVPQRRPDRRITSR